MDKRIKKSVATLLAHIIKVDKRDIKKEAALFCSLMGQDFGCNHEEARQFLENVMHEEYDLNEHVDIINEALKNDDLSKMCILEQLNHIIYSDTISAIDYKIFEKIRHKLFPEID